MTGVRVDQIRWLSALPADNRTVHPSVTSFDPQYAFHRRHSLRCPHLPSKIPLMFSYVRLLPLQYRPFFRLTAFKFSSAQRDQSTLHIWTRLCKRNLEAEIVRSAPFLEL